MRRSAPGATLPKTEEMGMSAAFERVKDFLTAAGLADRIRLPEGSSATVELAAQALGCRPEHIAKSLSFNLATGPVVIVVAGDAKVDNHRYKVTFYEKAHMIPAADVERLTGPCTGWRLSVCAQRRRDALFRRISKALYDDFSRRRRKPYRGGIDRFRNGGGGKTCGLGRRLQSVAPGRKDNAGCLKSQIFP